MLAFLILWISSFGASYSTFSCSRSLSRLARQKIETGFVHILEKLQASPITNCPILNDIYSNENEFRKLDGSQWRCLVCGKLFQSENYLDSHVARKHSGLTDEQNEPTSNRQCLADHCDWLRCDALQASDDLSYWQKALCDRENLANRQKKCYASISSCLPNSISQELHQQVIDHVNVTLCGYLTCEKYWEKEFSDASKVQTFFRVAISTVIVLVVFCYYILLLQMYCEGEINVEHHEAINPDWKLEMPQRFNDVPTIRKRTRESSK